MEFWDGCTCTSVRTYQKPDDAIFVFLNYKQVGSFKRRSDANLLIRKLLEEAPTDFSDLEHHIL